MEGGLYALQDLANVLAFVSSAQSSQVRKINNRLNSDSLALNDVYDVLEYNVDILSQNLELLTSEISAHTQDGDDEEGPAKVAKLEQQLVRDKYYLDVVTELKSSLLNIIDS